MTAYFEVILNAKSGETTIRPYTEAEIAAMQAQPEPPLPMITFAQLIIGLVSNQFITEAEGEAWLAGTLPAAVLAVIAQLPPEMRFAAKARALRPSQVDPNDQLVGALCAARNLSAAQKRQFFFYCASL